MARVLTCATDLPPLGSEGITIAKASQLPAVLSQRQESVGTSAEELQVGRSTADKKLGARSKVSPDWRKGWH